MNNKPPQLKSNQNLKVEDRSGFNSILSTAAKSENALNTLNVSQNILSIKQSSAENIKILKSNINERIVKETSKIVQQHTKIVQASVNNGDRNLVVSTNMLSQQTNNMHPHRHTQSHLQLKESSKELIVNKTFNLASSSTVNLKSKITSCKSNIEKLIPTETQKKLTCLTSNVNKEEKKSSNTNLNSEINPTESISSCSLVASTSSVTVQKVNGNETKIATEAATVAFFETKASNKTESQYEASSVAVASHSATVSDQSFSEAKVRMVTTNVYTNSSNENNSITDSTSKNVIVICSKKNKTKHELATGYGFNDDQIGMLEETFAIFDKDFDGVITPIEIRTVMNSLGFYPCDENIRKGIQNIDNDNSGTVDFEEFIGMMSKFRQIKTISELDDELKEIFTVFDKNGDGFIDKNELKDVLTRLGENITDDEVYEMIKEADTDGDNKVSFAEFKSILYDNKAR